MENRIEDFPPPNSAATRRGHKHKRSFALSGDNFEFLQPTNNHNGGNNSLPDICGVFKPESNSNSTSSNNSLNTCPLPQKPVIINFDDAEKFMLSKNNKPSSLRHKRSESAPSELILDSKASNSKQLSYDNWLDVGNTTMEDHINNSWENDYKKEDDSTASANVYFKHPSTHKGSTELLIEEDENESSSENSSPVKEKNLPPNKSTVSATLSSANTNGKYKVSSRNFSDSSYRSITPSSAVSTSGTVNSYRSIGKPQRERYYNFGIPYSPQGSRNSSNGSGTNSSNNTNENSTPLSLTGANNTSVNSNSDNSSSTTKKNSNNDKPNNSNNHNMLPLKNSAPSLRLNSYTAANNSAKYSPRMSYVTNSMSVSSAKSPFNFKPQEYDISKDLEELRDLDDKENADDNEMNVYGRYTFEENNKASISTILNTGSSNAVNSNSYLSQTPNRNSYNQSASRHSRQLTDTDSNLTLLASSTINNHNNNHYKQHTMLETKEPISVIEEPEPEGYSMDGDKSLFSKKVRVNVTHQQQIRNSSLSSSTVDTTRCSTNQLNHEKTNKNKKKNSIPSSISMSNLSIKSFSLGDRRNENRTASSKSGLKKSLSIQSLSKFLGKGDKKTSPQERSTDPRRQSFISKLFSRK